MRNRELHRLLRGDPLHVGDLLRLAALPAPVHGEAARLLAAGSRGRDAAVPRRLRRRLLRRRAALQPRSAPSRWPSSAPPASPSPRSSSRWSTRARATARWSPGMIVLGLGVGSFYPTATTAGVTSVDESQTSLAGGIVYMFQIAGGSIGLGLTTTVFSACDPALRRRHPGRLPPRRRSLAGWLPDRASVRRRQRCCGRAARRASRPPDSARAQHVLPGAAEQRVFARRRRGGRRRRCRRPGVSLPAPP